MDSCISYSFGCTYARVASLQHSSQQSLSPIIAGPILRRTTPRQVVIWLATSEPIELHACLFRRGEDTPFLSVQIGTDSLQRIRIGERAFVQLIDLRPTEPLPVEVVLEYDLRLETPQGDAGLADLLPHLLYEDERLPSFVVKTSLDNLLHGSCRKPHYPSRDALVRVDEQLCETRRDPRRRPALLMMTGDQVYADDVVGPMLVAIHKAIQLLGLFPESLKGALVSDSETLFASEYSYYQREELLPHTKANQALRDRFFGGARKPIFTSDSAHNHLITLAEVTAMYLLVWSPQLWTHITLATTDVQKPFRGRYAEELREVQRFAASLARVQRALAHVPVYMIFDDHDVTDDWNLTRGWEEAAYANPLSRRIIGNALIAYWLFQAWANTPAMFDERFLEVVHDCFAEPGGEKQDALIDLLLDFDHWHYSVPTTPKLVVMDTRTHRWWSETSLAKPSGLVDWEELSDLQQELMDEPAVVLVSPAPIFGVKLIETVQRMFTFFGHALLVDAENWMAHPGSANVILNIFRHRKTPQHFVILSGDVHYSFVYDVKIRFRENSPDIWQITCSGLKNEFPRRLLCWFDRLNRWLYASHSPLNWFTKRRRMGIHARQPEGLAPYRLANFSGVGRVSLNKKGVPAEICLLPADGGVIRFPPPG